MVFGPGFVCEYLFDTCDPINKDYSKAYELFGDVITVDESKPWWEYESGEEPRESILIRKDMNTGEYEVRYIIYQGCLENMLTRMNVTEEFEPKFSLIKDEVLFKGEFRKAVEIGSDKCIDRNPLFWANAMYENEIPFQPCEHKHPKKAFDCPVSPHQ